MAVFIKGTPAPRTQRVLISPETIVECNGTMPIFNHLKNGCQRHCKEPEIRFL